MTPIKNLPWIAVACLALAACGRGESPVAEIATSDEGRVESDEDDRPVRTGVYVNGKDLNSAELQALRQILPGIFPGRWQMAQNGDFGPEGKRPVLNLVAVMRSRVSAQLRARMQAQASRQQAQAYWQAQATELMRQRAYAVRRMYATQGWGWNDGNRYLNGNWAQGGYSGALSSYDRTGTGVYGDSNGLVGVMTEGGSWYPGQ